MVDSKLLKIHQLCSTFSSDDICFFASGHHFEKAHDPLAIEVCGDVSQQ